MRAILVGGTAAVLAVATAGAAGALAAGNGAQVSGLSPQKNTSNTDCATPGSGSHSNGFAMLNAPGQPGNARLVNGEVSLQGGPANAMYTVTLAEVKPSPIPGQTQTTCLTEGALTTNGQGNGNAHLADASLTGGTYYVVLSDANGEEFASGEVTVR